MVTAQSAQEPAVAATRASGVLLLAALAVGFSPTWLDLAGHWWAHGWTRYSLVFALLLVHACARGAGATPRPWLGVALIAAGLAGQVVAVVISALPLARPTLGLAIVGFVLLRGSCPWRLALLGLWIVPVPHALLDALGDDALAMAEFRAAAALLSPLGLEFGISRHFVDHGGTRIVLDSIHNGVLLAVHLGGLAWYRAARLGQDMVGTLRTGVIFALCVLPLQLATQLAGLCVLAAGAPGAASVVLHSGGWLAATLVVVWRTERAARLAAQPPSPSREVSSRSQ